MKTVGWGAGDIARRYIARGAIKELDYIIDGNYERRGTDFCGYKIVHSSDIDDWDDLYVIILVENENVIAELLEQRGLVRNKNYISYMDLLSSDLKIIDKQQELIVKNGVENDYQIVIRNKDEYTLVDRNNVIAYENDLNELYKHNNYIGRYAGYCPICKEKVNLRVEYIDNKKLDAPVWSETLKCPHCFCNRRNRFAYEYISQFDSSLDVYIYEYTTSNYKNYKKIFPNIIGSEFLGMQYKSGEIIEGIMHQDALNLSFESNSFDLMLSFDVFEHVSDCEKAFREAYRCLKSDGKLIFTIPFDEKLDESVIRAYIDDEGRLINILEPEIHGNPLSNEGSLAFYNYGWDILDYLKRAGFSDAYVVNYFSANKGYIGNYCLLFVAEKKCK